LSMMIGKRRGLAEERHPRGHELTSHGHVLQAPTALVEETDANQGVAPYAADAAGESVGREDIRVAAVAPHARSVVVVGEPNPIALSFPVRGIENDSDHGDFSILGSVSPRVGFEPAGDRPDVIVNESN